MHLLFFAKRITRPGCWNIGTGSILQVNPVCHVSLLPSFAPLRLALPACFFGSRIPWLEGRDCLSLGVNLGARIPSPPTMPMTYQATKSRTPRTTDYGLGPRRIAVFALEGSLKYIGSHKYLCTYTSLLTWLVEPSYQDHKIDLMVFHCFIFAPRILQFFFASESKSPHVCHQLR